MMYKLYQKTRQVSLAFFPVGKCEREKEEENGGKFRGEILVETVFLFMDAGACLEFAFNFCYVNYIHCRRECVFCSAMPIHRSEVWPVQGLKRLADSNLLFSVSRTAFSSQDRTVYPGSLDVTDL